MKVLITGSAGFIGGFLVKYCLDKACSVFGVDIVEPSEVLPGATFEFCDIRNSVRLLELISSFKPDRIFHLAAQSYPTISLDQPRETIDINVGGTVNLFECIRSAGIMPAVVVACSSAEYGPVASDDLPVRESHPLRPLHPYGVSKVGQDLLSAQYFANYSIPAIRIRIFNTTGPGKIGDLCSDLTRRAVEIELGIRLPSLNVGNRTQRAIIDVRDMVRGLWLAAECCEAGDVYNVGSNTIYSVDEVIDVIRSHSRVTFRDERDPGLVRGQDEPVIAGDTSKFRSCTDWKPEIDMVRTIQDMLDWWRHRLASPQQEAQHAGAETSLIGVRPS